VHEAPKLFAGARFVLRLMNAGDVVASAIGERDSVNSAADFASAANASSSC
jgi:hypothetical protein